MQRSNGKYLFPAGGHRRPGCFPRSDGQIGQNPCDQTISTSLLGCGGAAVTLCHFPKATIQNSRPLYIVIGQQRRERSRVWHFISISFFILGRTISVTLYINYRGQHYKSVPGDTWTGIPCMSIILQCFVTACPRSERSCVHTGHFKVTCLIGLWSDLFCGQKEPLLHGG